MCVYFSPELEPNYHQINIGFVDEFKWDRMSHCFPEEKKIMIFFFHISFDENEGKEEKTNRKWSKKKKRV